MRSRRRIARPGGTPEAPGHEPFEQGRRLAGRPVPRRTAHRSLIVALARGIIVKLKNAVRVLVLVAIAGPVLAQSDPRSTEKVIITGSSIKRIEGEGSLPVQVFTRQDLNRQGISSAEQFIMSLDSNAN